MKFIVIYVAFATFLFASGAMMLVHYKKLIRRIWGYIVLVIGTYGLISAIKVIDFKEGYIVAAITFLVFGAISALIAELLLRETSDKRKR
ncbi:MAG: hypothetical protein E7019_02450 [Alphaproteobacteria bacterium]|nr:hypothetical protein [Alphaproteobacteria bacterium]